MLFDKVEVLKRRRPYSKEKEKTYDDQRNENKGDGCNVKDGVALAFDAHQQRDSDESVEWKAKQ